MGFGEWIRERRSERGLSQKEAAARLKISPSRLAEIEAGVTYARGRPTRPSRELVLRMAVTYGLAEELLLAEAGFPVSKEPELSSEARKAIAMFDALSEEGQRLTLAFMRMLLAEGK